MPANQITVRTGEDLRVKPSIRAPGNVSINVLGVPFDNLTLAETLERFETMIVSGQPHYVATANVDFVVRAGHDPRFRRALLGAHVVLCDGTPLVWASRLLGTPLRERVAGSDVVNPL